MLPQQPTAVQIPTAAQIAEQAKAELKILQPRMLLCQQTVERLTTAANRCSKELEKYKMPLEQDPIRLQSMMEFATCQGIMVLLESSLAETALRLEEMQMRAQMLTKFVEDNESLVKVPGRRM